MTRCRGFVNILINELHCRDDRDLNKEQEKGLQEE